MKEVLLIIAGYLIKDGLDYIKRKFIKCPNKPECEWYVWAQSKDSKITVCKTCDNSKEEYWNSKTQRYE